MKNNSKAMVSMIVGIVSWVLTILIFCFNSTIGSLLAVATMGIGLLCLLPLGCLPPIGWIITVIYGHLGLNEIRNTGEPGRGMAIAGLVMGYIGLGIILLSILAVVGILLLGGTIPLLGPIFDQISRQLGGN
jgi:hypothetical protein